MGWADAKKKYSDKAADGEWKCAACYVKNQDGTIICAACETPKEGHEAEAKKLLAERAKAEQAKKMALMKAKGGGATFGFGAKKPAAGGAKKPFQFVGAAKPKTSAFGGTGFGNALPAKAAFAGFGVKPKAGSPKAFTGFKPQPAAGAAKSSPAPKRQKSNEEAPAGKTPAFLFGVKKAGAGGAPAPFKFGVPKTTSQPEPEKAAVVDDSTVAAIIEGEGKLGLSFKKDTNPPVLASVPGQGLAATCAPDLAEGMVLLSVAGAPIAGMERDAVMALIKGAARPIEMVFKRVGVVREEREQGEVTPFIKGKTAGCVLVSGSGECGQLGMGTRCIEAMAPRHLSLLDRKNVVNVAAGGLHCVALDEDGGLWSWGCDDDGALGRDDSRDEGVPRQIKALAALPVVAVACGLCHCITLTEGGSIYTWGTYKDANGYVGFKVVDGEKVKIQKTPMLLEELEGKGVTTVESGGCHSLAITDKGELWAWGNGEHYQLGRPISQKHKLEGLTPKVVEFAAKRKRGGGDDSQGLQGERVEIVAVAGGGNHTLALDKAGNSYAWGLNTRGQCGLGHTSTHVQKPMPIAALDQEGGVVELAAGAMHSMCRFEDGSVSCWGRGDYAQLGYPCPPKKVEQATRAQPVKVCVPSATFPKAKCISAGDNHSLMVSDDGALFTWGFGIMGALALGDCEELPTANSSGDITEPTEVAPDLLEGSAHDGIVMLAAAGSQHTVILAL